MDIRNLKLIIQQEYKSDVKAKSFWISTFLVPLLMVLVGVVLGFLMSESSTATAVFGDHHSDNDGSDLSAAQAIGLFCGMALTFFVLTCGSQIFNKVKVEKCNRIMEVLATCVEGREMIIAKVITVALVSFTQLLAWGVIIGIGVVGVITIFHVNIPWDVILTWRSVGMLFWCIGFFIGGYVFFASLFALCGATTDRNNENQEYVTVLSFILMMSVYLAIYAADNPSSLVSVIFSLIPFTATTCGVVGAVSGETPLWISFLSLAVLFACGYFTLMLAGKVYTTSLMLTGKKLTPKDLIIFLKAK